MDVCLLLRILVEDYGSYASSFIRTKDERIEEVLHSNLGTIEELVAEGILHEEGCTPEGRGVSCRDDPENGGPR